MDGGGRVAEPLTGSVSSPGASARLHGAAAERRKQRRRTAKGGAGGRARLVAWSRRLCGPLQRFRLLAGGQRRYRVAGLVGTLAIIVGALGYGAVSGGHLDTAAQWLRDGRDMAANALGFRIASVSISGHKHLSRDEILAIAGVSGRASLLFVDAAEARAKLVANPWIADATVQKLYPDRLAIAITERAAFALWQKGGQTAVIADDGTVLESFLSPAVMSLPFVVGAGAETRARDFLALLDRYPAIREQVRASVLVGERRWNLKLKNGVDVKLPEAGAKGALDRLAAFDRDKRLLARDIAVVDLRLPDRVTVRLSDSAAQAREEAIKAKRPKPKGGAA